ncbi:GHKL domain-containing protein [Colwellia sp. Arc7-635]|uniref:ATP-binding protein n=1 Tax=Colwellia sp. Arc7-635 TaxID=2497879 RepID=UPI000F858EFD|nr:ATP-binding protein [Colwellia sp. Arc7-635]AZQ84072.1 GHKL domain-containing protein [Colwellia sp. Arc7-635]
MIFILLPIVGLIISNAYEKHMVASIENELSAYSYSILAIIEVEDDTLVMPEQLLETQFNVSQSGLYAVLTKNSETLKNNARHNSSSDKLWSSQSLLAPWQAHSFRHPKLGKSAFYQVEIAKVPHYVYSLSVSYGSEQQPFSMTLHIIKEQTDLTYMMAEFHHQLILGLAGLMLVLLMIQYLWSLWTLKPLNTLRIELSDVEQGKSERLSGSYPTELHQVTEQLNLLLSAEQKQRQRYRNALSDLAHSLKTPLAVMQTQQELSALTQEQLNIINAMIEHQLRKAQSAGQSSWHLGTTITPIAKKLVSSLEKIYREKSLIFNINIAAQCNFKGDEADLLEILGNLLDNACKAAASKVQLDISYDEKTSSIMMVIQDDGSGIEPVLREEILKRGTRADTYQQGHGIGLAIVRDLVDSYQGSIVIDSSAQLKGAKFTLKFPS